MSVDAGVHEQGLAAFLVARRRERFADGLASGGKARAKETARLSHQPDLDDRYVRDGPALAKLEPFLAVLEARVREIAPTADEVYVVSADPDLDGISCSLAEALERAAWADAGSLISIEPGRVALYVGELVDDTRLLIRPGGGR